MANDILITTESLKSILPAYENKILEQVKCNVVETVEPAENDIPTIFITGETPTKKEFVYGEMEYISKTDRFHAYTYIKLQGTSSMAHPKKNFAFELYKDNNRSVKMNKEFKRWGAHNDFVLKADYIDILHARNVVCAKLWSKVVASRPDYESLPEGLKNSPNNGAIDGFPVKVYVNGHYEGLYNWTIPKCSWLFGMDDNNENHVVLSSEFNDNGDDTVSYNPCNFRNFWDGSDQYFDVEVGNLSNDVIASFNNIITWAMESELDERYIDVRSVIDYYVFQDIILGIDGLSKNMLLATYDMEKWYLSAYDMDSTFDLHWEGFILNMYGAIMPEPPYLANYNKLVNILTSTTTYQDMYRARYWELRNSVLSETSIINAFEEYIGQYGEDEYIKDTAVYPDIPSVINNTLSSLRTFITKRLAFLDSQYAEVV